MLKLRDATEEIMSSRKKGGVPGAVASSRLGLGQGENEIHHTLFIDGLTKATKTSAIEETFANMKGIKEVRVIPLGEKNVGFVEFENEDLAYAALQALNLIQLKDSNGEIVTLLISFAKK